MSDSYFINTTSKWANDSIYVGPNFKNITLENIACSGNYSRFCIDGRFTNFNPFTTQYKLNALGHEVDFTRCIFEVLTFGGINTLADFTYYGQILNETDFLLVFNQNKNGNYMNQEFYFNKVTKNNNTTMIADNLFKSFKNTDYTINFIFLHFVNISNIQDYENAIKLKSKNTFGIYNALYTTYSKLLKKEKVTCVTGLRVNFLDQYTFKTHSTWKPKDMGFNTIYINGHNSIIDGDAGKRDEYKWASIKEDYMFTADNITITRFNNAIVNEGYCVLNNVILHKNKMRYYVERDWGAAILNAGLCICTNCKFTDNYCSNGGAIFNQGSLSLDHCTFQGNDAYRKGNNVLNVDKGVVFVDGKQINGTSGYIKYTKSVSSSTISALEFGCKAISFLAGVVASGLSGGNLLLGAAVGAGVGLVLSTALNCYIYAHKYDIHYNALKASLILSAETMACGIFGGLICSSYDLIVPSLFRGGITLVFLDVSLSFIIKSAKSL